MEGLYKRREVFWLRFTPAPGAAQCRVSTGETDQLKALAAARAIRQRAGSEMREIMGSCETEVAAYMHHQRENGLARSTLQSRAFVIRAFIADTGAKTPNAITREACARWFERRRALNVHTACAYLMIIRCWFEWLVKRGKLAVNPAAAVQPPARVVMRRRRRRFLMHADARRLIDTCQNPSLKFALYCALHAGMRKLEIIEASPSWFDLDAGLLHIQATATFQPKDRDNRTIPLTEEFCEWIKNEYGLRAPFMLAPEARHGKSRYRFDFRKAYEAHVKECALEDLTFHDLRRTFASLLVSKGISIYKVAKWLGDLVSVVENTYGHLIPQDEEINAVWK